MKLALLKLKISFVAIGRLMLKPIYGLLAIVIASITLAVVLWAFNLNLLWFVLFDSGLPLLEQFNFLAGIYGSIATNFESSLALTLVLFSILFGINMSALVFVLRQRVRAKAAAGKSIGGLAGAIVGAACAACGTSIVAPLLSALGATGTVGLANSIGAIVNILSIGLILFAIYSLGKVVANLEATNQPLQKTQ